MTGSCCRIIAYPDPSVVPFVSLRPIKDYDAYSGAFGNGQIRHLSDYHSPVPTRAPPRPVDACLEPTPKYPLVLADPRLGPADHVWARLVNDFSWLIYACPPAHPCLLQAESCLVHAEPCQVQGEQCMFPGLPQHGHSPPHCPLSLPAYCKERRGSNRLRSTDWFKRQSLHGNVVRHTKLKSERVTVGMAGPVRHRRGLAKTIHKRVSQWSLG